MKIKSNQYDYWMEQNQINMIIGAEWKSELALADIQKSGSHPGSSFLTWFYDHYEHPGWSFLTWFYDHSFHQFYQIIVSHPGSSFLTRFYGHSFHPMYHFLSIYQQLYQQCHHDQQRIYHTTVILDIIQDWNHFCIAYSSITKRMVVMHNGNLEVDHTRPAMVKEVMSSC